MNQKMSPERIDVGGSVAAMQDDANQDPGTTEPTPTTSDDGSRERRAWIAGLVAVALIAGGLGWWIGSSGSDDENVSGTGGTSTSSSTTTTTTTDGTTSTSDGTTSEPTTTEGTGGGDPMEGAGTAEVSSPTPTIETTHLTRLQTARHDGYDRVTFELDGEVPGYRVGYIDGPVTEDPSDLPVEVAGEGYLSVTLAPASAVEMTGDTFEETFAEDRVSGSGGQVTEVVDAGDFEAQMTWVIGTRDGKVPFKVTTLTSPSRVVIDLAAG